MVRNTEPKKICFTLRQWSLLLAIIAFIVTAVLTFGAMLGLRHTRDAWELVLSDLAEEDRNANSVYLDEQEQYKSNKRLLHQSQHVVQVMIFLLDIGTIFGCLNQIACGLMVYGIAVRSPKCILPWIIISGITYMLVVTTIFISFWEMIPGVYVSLNELIAALSISSIFIIVWYTMLLYYYYLMRPTCGAKKIGTITPNIIQAYGGYIHRVDGSQMEKKAVV